MNLDFWFRFLLSLVLINYIILMIWFLAIIFARDWIKQVHGKWFNLSDATFDAIHYGGMAVYKIGILLFNLVPLIALYFMDKS
ncbi:DUF6868 family protein [Acinetobacter terrae]|uniref:DUF6868 domain-containing protein n=1 Tax=Acinetobacter terrae TaxID=2731247 RepID=A0A4R0ENS3_9GAMM|nr:hypothetical protein [Acinetobacter terrae]NNH16302.1 hypothetical protein [Acinetobacter terrae]OAL86294.1 hypothetical protein AY608_13090 [Acinetobacter terrae]TCB60320.1 hypothetical protein E0H85_05995 [Acinetobacter terrae]